jgi:hypothetical protein
MILLNLKDFNSVAEVLHEPAAVPKRVTEVQNRLAEVQNPTGGVPRRSQRDAKLDAGILNLAPEVSNPAFEVLNPAPGVPNGLAGVKNQATGAKPGGIDVNTLGAGAFKQEGGASEAPPRCYKARYMRYLGSWRRFNRFGR